MYMEISRDILLKYDSYDHGFSALQVERPDLYFDLIDSLLGRNRKRIETYSHACRVGMLSRMLACVLGLPPEYQDHLANASPLHDVGMLFVPEAILSKPSKLNMMEWVVMTNHSTRGWELLKACDSKILTMASLICLSHHERWDGYGYPRGLSKEDIPLPGQIVAVADSFDSIVSSKPYRQPFALEEGILEIKGLKGTQFSPLVVHAFSSIERSIMEFYTSDEDLFQDSELARHLVS